MRYPRPNSGRGNGSVMLEAVICLPFVLLMLFLTAQLAHIMFCRQVIQYASAAAARATLAAADGENEKKAATAAARRICAFISYTSEGGTPLQRSWIDGVILQGSGGAAPDGNKLTVTVDGSGVGPRKVSVEFQTPMLFPFANWILAGSMNFWKTDWYEKRDLSKFSYSSSYFPHILLTGNTAIFKPAVIAASGESESAEYEAWNVK